MSSPVPLWLVPEAPGQSLAAAVAHCLSLVRPSLAAPAPQAVEAAEAAEAVEADFRPSECFRFHLGRSSLLAGNRPAATEGHLAFGKSNIFKYV